MLLYCSMVLIIDIFPLQKKLRNHIDLFLGTFQTKKQLKI